MRQFDPIKYRRERQDRLAQERLDILEAELPRGVCSVRGCNRGDRLYEQGGFHGAFYVCSRHRALYRTHARIVEKIRSLR